MSKELKSRFNYHKISVGVLLDNKKLLHYLKNSNIKRSNRGGAFVSSGCIAPSEFASYGVVLPRGGMIIDTLLPDSLERIVRQAADGDTLLEIEGRKKHLGTALGNFYSNNDPCVMDLFIASRAWRDGTLTFHPFLSGRDRDRREAVLRRHIFDKTGTFDGYDMLHVQYLIEQRLEPELLRPQMLASRIKIGLVFCKRVKRFFDFSDQGLKLLEMAWDNVSEDDEIIFRRLLNADVQRAVVFVVDSSLYVMGEEYKFSYAKVAVNAYAMLRNSYDAYAPHEAVLAKKIAEGGSLTKAEIGDLHGLYDKLLVLHNRGINIYPRSERNDP